MEGKEVQNLAQRVATRIGAECGALRTAPDFHRYRLLRGEERELVDVVVDRAPQLDSQKALFDGIRVDTLREIIANKLTTLLSRSEVKDVVDLYFLEQAGHDIPAVVSMLLDGLDTTELPPWLLRAITPEDLQAFLHRLRLAIAAKALPES